VGQTLRLILFPPETKIHHLDRLGDGFLPRFPALVFEFALLLVLTSIASPGGGFLIGLVVALARRVRGSLTFSSRSCYCSAVPKISEDHKKARDGTGLFLTWSLSLAAL
jgi:hypothetical protein